MSQQHDTKYILGFAVVVSVVCALLLSTASTLLSERQQANVALDKRKNILKALSFDTAGRTADEINATFESRIKPVAIDSSGNEINGLSSIDIEGLNAEAQQKNPNESERQYPLFLLQDDRGQLEGFCIPIFGKGLWSTLYGYIALEADGNTVKGITYYKHGETPGLGAEVENPVWQKQFTNNKAIRNNDDELVGIEVVKSQDTSANPHAVDSISGATITSVGVTNMLKKDLAYYDAYLRNSAK